MKITSSDFFKDYTVYKSLRKNEGRFYVTMVHNITKSHRIMSYARYVMASHLCRELSRSEKVDHIDEDKTNDDISNLQILNDKQNIQKHVIAKGRSAKYEEKTCPSCGSKFNIKLSVIRSRTKEGRKHFFCSRKCIGYGVKI